ncbi:Ig-like domain-containing protein, partial [Pantoea sp. Pa-EAmG]|uniref:Ig-like domain-containing protein n=1 Tax=Pantoea sp. Pa-EAmG TaxID=3043311 RepID=UPI0024AEC0C9
MSSIPVNAAVVDKNTIVRAEVLGGGKVVKVKAVAGGKYILSEGENGFAPENVTLKRVGKNLQVFLEGEDKPQLEIEGFYDNPGELVGKGEDGQWHEYIATSGDDNDAAGALLDGETSAVALGAGEYAGASSLANLSMAGLSPALIALGALAALAAATGLGYLIGHAGKDDNHGNGSNDGTDGGKGGDGGNPPPGGELPNTIEVIAITDRDGHTLPSGGTSNDNAPVFSGIGTPGHTVIIREDGEDIGSVIVDGDGNWTWTPQPPLQDGDHDFELVEGDGNGNVSAPKPGPELIIDTVAPASGKIEDLLNDDGVSVIAAGVTNDATPTVVGSVSSPEPGLRVEIFNKSGELVGSADVATDGTWRSELTTPLTEGPNELYIVVVDAANNRSLPSEPVSLLIDFTAPVMPGDGAIGPGGPLEGAWDDVEPQTGYITPGGSTNDQQPEFRGGGLEPGDTVIIRDKDEVIGSVIVDDDGSWTFTPDTDMAEGDHSVDIIIRDPAGNESEPSDPLDFIVDITPPGKPTTGAGGNLDLALDDVGIITGPIAEDGVTDDARPEFNGGGLEPGDVVIISDEFEGVMEVIGSVIVDGDGNWSFTPDTDMGEGEHDVRIIVRDPAGNESEPSDPYHFEIDLTAPVLDPSIGPGKPFEGAWDDVGDYEGWITTDKPTDDARPEFKGSGLTDNVGDIVIIRDNGKDIGSTTIDSEGNWSWTPDTDMPNGSHSVDIRLRDEAGNESAPSDTLDFTIITGGAPARPTITGVYNDDGAGEHLIQERSPSNDATPVVRGTGGEKDNVIYVYNGTDLVGTAIVQEDRTWSFKVPEPGLTPGNISFHVVEENAASNRSEPSGNWDYVLDVTAPDAPTLSLINDIGSTEIPIGKGDTTPDDTPILRGSSDETGGSVEVWENGELLGTAVVHPDGSWSFPVPALDDGEHNLEVIQIDPAGNRSAPSEYNFEVDTSLVAVRITHLSEDNSIIGDLASPARTNDSTPTVHGIATPGQVVTVFVDGTAVGSVTSDVTTGAWQFDLNIPTDGTYEVRAEVNGSPTPSGNFEVTLDTAAPAGSFDRVIDNLDATDVELANGAATRDTTPRLEGRVNMAGETSPVLVTIYNGTTAVGSVYADASTGNWNWTPDPLHDNTYNYHVTFTDDVGNVSTPSADRVITVDTMPPAAPVITSVVDDFGTRTGDITSGGTTDDQTPTLNGTAEGGTVITVEYNDGTGWKVGTVTAADSEGKWAWTPDSELAYGDYQFRVKSE